MRALKITVDTNVLPIERVLQAIEGLNVELVACSVTARELTDTTLVDDLPKMGAISEALVLGESPLGTAVLADSTEADLFEQCLAAISNGSFPKPAQRGALTAGQKRQLRDVMIFCAHVRKRRDVFVSDDVRAFGNAGGPLRSRLEELGKTRIMTLTEFEWFCADQRRGI